MLLFISESPFKNYKNSNNNSNYTESNSELYNNDENSISIKETFLRIKNAFKNKNLIGFIGILLFSKVGLIFSMKLTALILIDKGYPQENLTYLSMIMTFIEIFISIKLSNLKKDFLKYYLNAYKMLFLVLSFEIIILISYEFYKEIIDRNSFIFLGLLLTHNIIKTYFFLICFLSVSGFFHKITDRSIGATYITALNSSNNLSEKWPGLFIFLLVDYINYKIIGLISILYCIGFYILFKKKLLEYDDTDESEWSSFKVEKDKKVE